MTQHFCDLSHTIEHGMITYKGLPAPLVCDYLSREESRKIYAEGTEFQIAKIEMVANTGTYLDSPFHRYADGHDLAQLTLGQLANLETIVIRTERGRRAITPESLGDHDLSGKAVLFDTGWYTHWRTEQYFEGHPFLTEQTAIALKQAGVVLVGIDSYNIDDVSGNTRPVHSTLLGANIPIVEHLCHLEQLPDRGSRFFAVPPKFHGVGTFPIRAFALVD